ncbi:hypothetical protein [Streptomyces regalis]|uniref:hypothetical protein n=1 Tax=Streptomyces regalis TaxID=68262 RepID=UPI000AD0C2B9|nr:hypothetical protein [Streptomyces regalis]
MRAFVEADTGLPTILFTTALTVATVLLGAFAPAGIAVGALVAASLLTRSLVRPLHRLHPP